MNQNIIEILFWKTLEQPPRNIYTKLSRITRNHIYNWINKRGKSPSLGDMLEVLFELEMISVEKINT
jgi:hypothetical protein